MRLLIDTHVLLWVLEADTQLSARAKALIRSTTNEVFVSAASLLEISIKRKIDWQTDHNPIRHGDRPRDDPRVSLSAPAYSTSPFRRL